MSKVCTKSLDIDKQEIEFTFADGEIMILPVGQLSDEIKINLMMHGGSQKGGDSYASSGGVLADAKASLKRIIDNLIAGNWTAGRSDGETKPRTTELAAALASIKGVDYETAQSAVEAADEAKRKAWRSHPRIKAAIASMRAEKAAAKAAAAEQTEISLD